MDANVIKELQSGLSAAYINGSVAANLVYKPAFVSNNPEEGKKVISSVEVNYYAAINFRLALHPFHLYEGERLDDMVESIREHGILNSVIVLKTDDGYEMLSGHNRANAAKIAGLSEVPAIIKVGLSESEAYVYVIETNLMQRSFGGTDTIRKSGSHGGTL